MRRLLFDIEGNGLLDTLTKLHCIAIIDIDSGQLWDFGPDELDKAVEVLKTGDELWAHNGIKYDFPGLQKVLGYKVPFEKQRDSLVAIRLKHPNIRDTDSKWNAVRLNQGRPSLGTQFGKHTIEAWGWRLGIPKLHADIEDWSKWTPEIQERCVGDIRTAHRILKYCDPWKLSQDALHLEHRIQRLTDMITDAGWPFNVPAAHKLDVELTSERDELEKKLVGEFGGWWAPKGPAPSPLKDAYAIQVLAEHKLPSYKGAYVPKIDRPKLGYVKGQPCTKIEWITFSPQNRKHIIYVLRKLGWKPTEFTPTGEPKLDDDTIDAIATDIPQAQGLTRYLMLSKRISQLTTGAEAWLKHVDANGLIHGQYNPLGTVTSRAAHMTPNLGQVPAAAAEYGKECRELFTVPPGWRLLGADMASLEGRCLAHYLAKTDGGAYGKVLLTGDPHWAVVRAMQLLDCARDKHNDLHTICREVGAKRGFYALIYGAGKEKLGRIILDACRAAEKIGHPELMARFYPSGAPTPRQLQSVGGTIKDNVIAGIPGFTELMDSIMDILRAQEAKGVKQLTVPGIDKRRIPIRSEHSALNALLQSCGAILCKRWICDAYDDLIAAGYKWGWDGDFVFVGWIHDELQTAVRDGLEDTIGPIITAAAKKAGEPYGFRIALDSDYTVGSSWRETH